MPIHILVIRGGQVELHEVAAVSQVSLHALVSSCMKIAVQLVDVGSMMLHTAGLGEQELRFDVHVANLTRRQDYGSPHTLMAPVEEEERLIQAVGCSTMEVVPLEVWKYSLVVVDTYPLLELEQLHRHFSWNRSLVSKISRSSNHSLHDGALVAGMRMGVEGLKGAGEGICLAVDRRQRIDHEEVGCTSDCTLGSYSRLTL
jgi:hypothetical protein